MPRVQVSIIRIFSEVLATSKSLIAEFNTYPYVPVMNHILALKASLPHKFDKNLIRSSNYHILEIDQEVNKIITIIGKENLQYIIYGIVKHIMS